MVRGIGAGMVSGGLVGVVVMSILSLYAPLPQDKIDAAPKLAVETQKSDALTPEQATSSAAPQESSAPVSAESSAVLAETPVVADTAEPVAATGAAPTTQAAPVEPQNDAPVVEPTAPQLDSSSTKADSPTAEIATSDATLVRPVPDAPAMVSQGNDDIIIASAEPAPELATQVGTGVQAPTADPSPNVPASTDTAAVKVQPSALQSLTVIGTEQPVVAQDAPAAPARGSSLPTIGDTPQEDAPFEVAAADTPITLPQVDSGVVTNRLPSVGGGGASSLITAEPAEPAEPAAEPAVVQAPENLGALRAYSTPVEGVEGKSLFGVILIDSGEDGLSRADLMKLSIPVTIAIDPTAPDAARIMQDYRAAGLEVVAIANELPTASAPGDVAVAVAAYFQILDQAVGLMDPLDGRIQSNRSLLQPVLGAIRKSGHGLITYDRGLNTAQQAARREDIPAATVFRVLDADLEEAPKIKRYLDRAAFNANRDGSVVVVGRSYPETVKAIVEWVLEKKEAGIAMVPVSAVMLADDAS